MELSKQLRSFIHTLPIRENTRSTNALLTGIESIFPTSFGEVVVPKDEVKMGMTPEETENPLVVNDVQELLEAQYAINAGGKSKEGCPIIIFPDNLNFHLISDAEYQQLMLYLTSVSSMQEADLGFHIIVDRRKDRWNSIKAVLLKISGYFPGLVHAVYVIRPESFLQKALSEVSNKLFKEQFKFRFVVLSSIDELYEYIDTTQLTPEFGGTLFYKHDEWIKQRVLLEKFSVVTKEVSDNLDKFTQKISETEFLNDVEATQQMLDRHNHQYSELKKEILVAAKHGEALLSNIKGQSNCQENEDSNFIYVNSETNPNIFAVERLLVQLEETERTFDKFWQQHFIKLRQCLELRRFEQDFRELQSNFDTHLKTVSEMTEIGETVNRVDTLIYEINAFEKLCSVDIDRVEEVVSSGQLLLQKKFDCAVECVEPKCLELTRVSSILTERIARRIDVLTKCRDLMERVEKANKWCTRGVDLLATQQIEKCCSSVELAEQSLHEIQQFIASAGEFKLNSPKEFRTVFQDSITPETKALVTQVLQRIDDVSLMCDKRIASLKKLTLKPPRPVQTVNPKPALPLQPSGGAPHPQKGVLKKANTVPKMNLDEQYVSGETDILQDDERKAKRGHVLAELKETEQIYVNELSTILTGYKREMESKEMQALMPPGLADKIDVLFGNLDEIYDFHANVFLRDLENCITSIDLVALCFVQRRDMFYHLYSYYCQNIPRSEQVRDSLNDNSFFKLCQTKLGHKLPLAAYLLKPVQRITKYQLLLKDLLRYSNEGNCCKELQQALDCMLVVLKLVNDSMHQIAITGFPIDLSQQGELLLQGSFSVWTENKKDLRLRLKPMQRHIFLYQKVMLFCKQASKTPYNKTTYHFKHYVKMSQIGLTESVKGDGKKFEIWLQGRQEVHLIQAATVDQKQTWVNEIKRVLLNQLEELKGEKSKQYPSVTHRPLLQTNSWEKQNKVSSISTTFSIESDNRLPNNIMDVENVECIENHGWRDYTSDYSNSEDDEVYTDHQTTSNAQSGGHYTALADYCAVGNSEISMHEGDTLELLKVGCAGWWFVRIVGGQVEGWAPAAYLSAHRKISHSSSKSQDRLNDNRD